MLVLLVSPHSLCDKNQPKRHCDRVARYYVDAISEHLSKMGCKIITHVSDALRHNHDTIPATVIDYNRPDTNKYPWRKKLDKLAIDNKPDLILEIHSYPGPNIIIPKSGRKNTLSSEFSDFVSKYFYQWRNNEVVVIHTKNGDRDGSHNFYRDLVDTYGDYDSVGVSSIDVNTAISTQLSPRFKHIFLEFNEQLENDKLAESVARVAVRQIKKNSIGKGDECIML